ncbi:heavy metal-binding domain-containing protein [Myxococcota bacterium]|nr:heavy metal-binding domain-containing protein [Myxococcota bacterium]
MWFVQLGRPRLVEITSCAGFPPFSSLGTLSGPQSPLVRPGLRHAEEIGAEAILAMRYDATEFMNGATEVLAYGTAVKLGASRTESCARLRSSPRRGTFRYTGT